MITICPIIHSTVIINEVNTNTPYSPEIGEFIELKYNANVYFDQYGIGPSLMDYYLLMIKPAEKSDPQPRIVFYSNLSDYHFINSTFFVIGCSTVNPDLLIAKPNVFTKYNVYSNQKSDADLIESGNSFPIAVTLVKVKNPNIVRELFEIRLSRSKPLLNQTSLAILSTMIMDMVVFARRAPFSRCEIFDFLLQSSCANWNKSLPYIFREYDVPGNKDYSLNKCNYTRKFTDCPSQFETMLGTPSPGCPNDCTGATFIIENYFNNTNTNTFPSSNNEVVPKCSSNVDQKPFHRFSSIDVVKLRNKIIEQSKQAGKTGSSSTPSENMYSAETSSKRQCIRENHDEMDTTEHSEQIHTTLQNTAVTAMEVSTLPIEQPFCFMKHAFHNDNPDECGTNGMDAELHKLSNFAETSLPDGDPYSVGIETEAELILARGNAIFDDEAKNSADTYYVCGKHLRILGKSSNFDHLKRKKSRATFLSCAFPALPGIRSHVKITRSTRLFLSKDQAQAIFEMKAKLLPVGLRK